MSQGWTSERLIFDGDEFFDEVIGAIDSAKANVDCEFYIYEDDAMGTRFSDALARASKRGVRVRLLVDGFGARGWIDSRAWGLASTGVQVRVYHPLRFSQLAGRIVGLAGLAPLRAATRLSGVLSRFNRRDHRKTVMIDARTAWVGSLNISASHSARLSGPTAAWRDIAARVEGLGGLRELERGFDYVFRRAHDLAGRRDWRARLLQAPPRARVSLALVRQNFTFPLRRRGFQEFLRRLSRAKRRIWITNAYLAPSAPVLRLLARAASRGVDVRILVPRQSDVFFMPWVAGSYYPPMLKNGIRIFEFLPRFHHAKSVIIDGWASVGTSNMNQRSLMRDMEVDVVLRRRASLRTLTEQFERDLEHCEEINSNGPTLKTWAQRLVGRLILLVMRNWI